VFKNSGLRGIFKGEDVTGSWRIMHNDELHKLYLPNITLMISRRMKWFG